MITSEELVRRLQIIQTRKGWTQTQYSLAAGLGENYIGTLRTRVKKKGAKLPEHETLSALAQAGDLSVDELTDPASAAFPPSEDVAETPSARLRLARERAGYPKSLDAVNAFGFTGSTYYAHENGSRGFDFETAEKYARVFNTSAQWLLSGKGTAPGDKGNTLTPPPVSSQEAENPDLLDEGLMTAVIASAMYGVGLERATAARAAQAVLRCYRVAQRHGVKPEETRSLDALTDSAREQ